MSQRVIDSRRPTGIEWKDVWTRSGSKYRLRAIVLMIVNAVLFAGVGCFAYWLRSGEFIAPARDGYWDVLYHTFYGVGLAEVSLGSLLVDPISVQDVPMQIPIVGLLMAALIAIPILVAILYRFWTSVPLLGVVAFLAVMPWLAITLLGACILASVKPLRTRFRFMSALIGLVPAVVYLALAWAGTTEAVVGRIDPIDRIKFVAPWVMAVVASTVVFAVVLGLAKVVDYRPGAVTPLLVLMFALPIALFEFHVGRDELYYRLLENLDQAYAADIDASAAWEDAARFAWQHHPLPRPSWEEVRKREEEKWLFELATDVGPRKSEWARRQLELTHACDQFHRSYPDSRYASNVFFIKARTLDRRLDVVEFRRTRWVRYYDDFPSVASRESWKFVFENRGDTPLGAVAALRLAQFAARDGDGERAAESLDALLATFGGGGSAGAATADNGVLSEMLDRPSPEKSLRIPLPRILLHARALRELLVANNDPLHGFAPLSGSKRAGDAFRVGLLDLDPRHEQYVENLRALKTQYPAAVLEDNIELEIAKAEPALVDRISALERFVDRFPRGDAAGEGLLRLAVAYAENRRSKQSDDVLDRLIRDFPRSIWAECAVGGTLRPAGERVGAAAP